MCLATTSFAAELWGGSTPIIMSSATNSRTFTSSWRCVLILRKALATLISGPGASLLHGSGSPLARWLPMSLCAPLIQCTGGCATRGTGSSKSSCKTFVRVALFACKMVGFSSLFVVEAGMKRLHNRSEQLHTERFSGALPFTPITGCAVRHGWALRFEW